MWKMKGVVKAKYINGDASLGAFGLADVAKEIVKAKMIITEKKEETKMEYFSQCHKLDEFSQKLNKLLYYFHHFDVAQILETQSVIESVIPLKVRNFS